MPQNIGDNFLDEDGIARITESDAQRLSKYRVEYGDIVYSRRGDVEKRSLIRAHNVGWLCGTGCLRVRLGSESPHDPVFLSYLLGTADVREWIVRHAVGATMPNLNTSILSAVPIAMPEPHVQRAIAEVLGALDDKIAANTKLIDAAKDLALLSLARHKPTVPLGSIVERHKATINPSLVAANEVAHFSLPAFDAGQTAEVTRPVDIKSSKFEVKQPSVLISKLNPRFPRVWNVAEVPAIPGLASTEFLVLEPSHSSTTFLWAELLQPSFGATLESKVAGTSGSHQRVRPADLLDTLVVDPREVEPELQGKITSVGLLAVQSRAENETLAATRDALLPQLMSGNLRIKEAEVLVEELV